LTDETVDAMIENADAQQGDLVLILAGTNPDVYKQMGTLRLMMGHDLDLIDHAQYNFLWVTDFPLVEWNADEHRYHALHHPFTAPKADEVEKLNQEPAEVGSRAYDLVLNGYEIGGGSIRINDRELQKKMFDLLGIDAEEAQKRFGFLLEAFKYGVPPHGGIALGVDRIVMILAGSSSLRDVIAFPKNQNAQSTMDGSPAAVDQEQLDELHIKLKNNLNS
jgi:aspartyl-tRNA synthetase